MTKQYAPLSQNILFVGDKEMGNPDNQLDGRVIVNSGFDCQYKRIKASVDLYNMLNTDYYQGGSFAIPIPQQKFNFIAKLAYVF